MYKRIALLGTILLLNSGIVRQPAIAQFLPRLPDFDSNSLEKEGRDLLGESLQLAQLQQVDLAITRAKLATQLIPQNADAWSVLGGLYLADNQSEHRQRRLYDVLDLVQLGTKRNSKIATLSRGMKQRLSQIGRAHV